MLAGEWRRLMYATDDASGGVEPTAASLLASHQERDTLPDRNAEG
jgi:hypothetical protein